MAQKLEQKNQLTITREAGEALTQYKMVKLNTDSALVDVADTADAQCLGVVDVDVESGDMAKVIYDGIAIVLAGAAVTVNTWLTVDATGRLITATTDAQFIVGLALSTASAAGDQISVLLRPAPTAAIA